MSSESPIAWLGRQKEKRALKLSIEHIEEIVETSESMKRAVHTFCENGEKIRENSEKVFDNEREADKVKSEIIEELSKGNFPPMRRENIIRLVLTADDIADNARAAAMKLTFLNPENVGEDLKKELKKLSDFAYEAVKLLKNAFSAMLDNPEAVREETAKVEKMEEKVDSFRSESLTPKLVKWADEANKPGTSYVLAEVENNIEESVDGTENCADVLREIAIESI